MPHSILRYTAITWAMDKLKLTGRALGQVLNFRSGCMHHTMHLRPGVAKPPNLELKTRPKELLGSLPLVIVLPAWADFYPNYSCKFYLDYIIEMPSYNICN